MRRGSHYQKSIESIARLRSKILKSRLLANVDDDCEEFLWGLLQQHVYPETGSSLGYLRLRLLAHEALVDAFSEAGRARQIVFRHARFATFAFQDGYAWLDEPIPSLKRIVGRIDKLCRHFDLSAVIFPEIEIVLLEGEPEPLFSYHHHGIVWRNDHKEIAPDALTAAMNGRPAVAGYLDKPAFISRNINDQSPYEMVTRMAGYSSKITSRIKQIWYDKEGERHLRTTSKGITGMQSVQLIHAWSLLELHDNVRGIGEGREVRALWKAKLKPRVGEAKGLKSAMKPEQMLPFWEKFWSQASNSIARKRSIRPNPAAGAKHASDSARARRQATQSATKAFIARVADGEREL